MLWSATKHLLEGCQQTICCGFPVAELKKSQEMLKKVQLATSEGKCSRVGGIGQTSTTLNKTIFNTRSGMLK